jgi:hypothetical protein
MASQRISQETQLGSQAPQWTSAVKGWWERAQERAPQDLSKLLSVLALGSIL